MSKSEAKHTPGPWLQYADTNIVICKYRGPGAEDLRICEVATNTRRDEGRHNLHLIAAAPNLLRTLTVIADALDTLDGLDNIKRLARAAIAAATTPNTTN